MTVMDVMASEETITETLDPPLVQTNSWSKEERKKNKLLRHAGLEYISRSGRTVAAKKQPDVICNCPQQCSIKVGKEIRERLFADFYALGDAHSQNNYLQNLIEIRSVHKRLFNEERKESGRLQRRVTCKYRVPLKFSPRERGASETSVIDGNHSQNNTLVPATDTIMLSEDNEDNLKIEKRADGETSHNEGNNGVEDLCEENPTLRAESVNNFNESNDSKENEKPPGKELIEAEESLQGDKSTILEAGKNQAVDITEEKLLTEQKLDANIDNKPAEIPMETAISSVETEPKSGNPSAPTPMNKNNKDSLNATPKLRDDKDTVEICQKAFMNIFAITEKRVRLQRERIIDELRSIEEKRIAEEEEMENSISVARELAAGCRPLLYYMDKSNQSNRIPSLPNKLLMAIDNDLTLVNNFFRNQLWKPENFNKRYKCDNTQLEADILE